MTWPDGTEMDHDQQIRIEMTCDNAWSPGFFMDPRSFDDNIQCSQSVQLRPAICRFPADDPPDVCNPIEDVKTYTEDDFRQTIKTCNMEDCLLNNVPADAYTSVRGTEIICNNIGNDILDYNEAVCCSEDELTDLCLNSMGGEEDDNDLLARKWGIARVALIVGGALSMIMLLVVLWRCRKKPVFSHKHQRVPLTSSDISQRHQLELIKKGSTYDPIRSPFETSNNSPSVGKRPELVVNIDVTPINNGWEKVGGYGRVRQAEYTDAVGQVHIVAVKYVDKLAPEAAWEALKNEFDILSSIPLHPNIVKPIGAHWGDRSENSERYIVEELMHTNLGDLMNPTDQHPYPNKIMLYRDWIRIFIDIACGLEHLHHHKIIHFDLKPRNVLLDEYMNAKIADFGCSKSKLDTYIELSRMAGTPPYLAPECWMLYYAQNCRTEVARVKIDVYSLGVIMWECLSGGSTLQSSLYKRAAAHSRSTSSVHPDHIEIRKDSRSSDGLQQWEMQYHLKEEIPEALRRLVNECVRVDFDARPTCEEILRTLRPMLNAHWVNQPVSLS